ncbi:MAG: stage VI sporulation protein F [Bacilli bacterium]|jgi:hypothetical protein
MFNENFFKKIEEKTNVNKEVILGLASKLQKGNLKDVNTLKEVITELSNLTGRKLSEDQEKKIIQTIVDDKVPKDLDNLME